MIFTVVDQKVEMNHEKFQLQVIILVEIISHFLSDFPSLKQVYLGKGRPIRIVMLKDAF